LLKTVDTKNESLFLITVEIISRHHKKILGVTINLFSSSDTTEKWEKRVSHYKLKKGKRHDALTASSPTRVAELLQQVDLAMLQLH
jgi:hypothetical protein